MENKLSELSKSVNIFIDGKPLYSQEYVSALLADNEAKDYALREIAFHVSAGGYNADSVDAEVFKQKIIDGINGISDVLVKRIAELAEREKRVVALANGNDELWEAMAHRLKTLEDKLATPVRLPDVLFIKVSGSAVPVMHAQRVKERVRAAGFTVEGDE